MADILTSKQHKAIAALLVSPTIQEAAASAGCGERTLRGWLAEDRDFQSTYRDARREAIGHAIAQLQQASAIAVSTLVDLMAFGPAPVRLSAASKVLDLAYRGTELEDIAVRLAALEQLYADSRST